MTENKGNANAMTLALQNILNHCFNEHKNCGEWCRYEANPDMYEHSVIGDGFTDSPLYDVLTDIFNNIALKSKGFSAGVSSNPNESFNASVASKAPKSQMYRTSSSYNFRVSFSVNHKNDGLL